MDEDRVKPAGRSRDITQWQVVKCKIMRRKEGRKEDRM